MRRSVSSVGFQGFVSIVLINDWLKPDFSANEFPDIRRRFRSAIRSFTYFDPDFVTENVLCHM